MLGAVQWLGGAAICLAVMLGITLEIAQRAEGIEGRPPMRPTDIAVRHVAVFALGIGVLTFVGLFVVSLAG